MNKPVIWLRVVLTLVTVGIFGIVLWAQQPVSQSGAWNITNVSGTVSLPTGASTSANQTTIIGHVDGVEGLLTTIDADTGSMLTALQILDDTAGETADEYLTVRLTDGSSFLAVGTDYTHDAALTAATTAGPVTMLLAADFDGSALPSVVSAEGDAVLGKATLSGVQYVMLVSEDGSLERGTATTPLVVSDGTGAMNVICDSGCSGGAQFADDAAFTLGSSLTTVAGAIRDDSLSTLTAIEGDVVPLRVSATGALHVTGGGGGTEYTVNAAAPADPTGATFVMERDDALSSLTEIEGDWTNPRSNANGALWTTIDGSVTVTDGSGALNVIVDSGTISLPSGASTSANQTTMITALDILDDTAGEVANEYLAVRLTDGTNFLTPGTDYTHDAALTAGSTAGPATLLLAADFDGSALPSAVSAEGDAVLAKATLSGVQYVMLVNEDGSLERGTSTTPLIVGDGAGALNVICDSGCSGGTQYTHNAALTADSTIGTASVFLAGDFDGAALPSTVNAEGDAVLGRASLSGVQYVMLVSEDGSAQYGTSTTPMVVDLGTNNDVTVTGTVTANLSATDNAVLDDIADGIAVTNAGTFAVQVDGSALTALQLIDNPVFVDDGAFTPASSSVSVAGFVADDTSTDSVDEGDTGAARMSLDRILYQRPGGAAVHYRTAAGTTEDEHEVKGSSGTLYSVLVTNTNASARYIRCYNLTAANTTPGTSTVFWGAAIPGATTGAGFVYTFPSGLTFDTALTCTFTTGAADSDVAEVAANEIKATYTYR